MFRTASLSIIRSVALYTQQWYMSHRFADCLLAISQHNLGSQKRPVIIWKNKPNTNSILKSLSATDVSCISDIELKYHQVSIFCSLIMKHKTNV